MNKRKGHFVFLSAYCLIVLVPFIWLALATFKSRVEFQQNPAGLPQSFGFDNFFAAWSQVNLPLALMNSAILAGFGVLGVVVLSAALSFALTRPGRRLTKVILSGFVAGLMVPINAAIIPLFVLIHDLGLLNSHLGVILPYIAFNLPLAVFLATTWMKEMPVELQESAIVDGANARTLFWTIVLPLSAPALGTIAILTFVNLWNEFLLALVLLTGEQTRTVPIALSGFKTAYAVERGSQSAGIVLSMLPMVGFYILFRRTIVAGISEGSTKG